MDVDRFLAQVPALFQGDPATSEPVDSAYAAVVADVAGFTSANELAVLNLAARMLPEDEAYLEVGTYKGRSLCGATLGVSGREFYACENYMEFGMVGREARAELRDNLTRYPDGAQVRLIEGDCFVTLARPGAVRRPIGVYFYDGKHSATAHYLALGVVEPLLADEALVLVDDATWPVVQKAHRAFLDRHPEWSVVARWDARTSDDPLWANGLHALRYRRPPGRAGGFTRDVRMLRPLQTRALGPAASAVWHTLDRIPALVPLAKKVYRSSPRSLDQG